MPCINLLPWRQKKKIARRRLCMKISLLFLSFLLLLALTCYHFFNKTLNQHTPIKTHRQLFPDIEKNHSPLTQYALHDLKLVAIIGTKDHYQAWIETPRGLLLRANIGDTIGKDAGTIIAINEEHLTIRRFKRISGQTKISMAILSIRDH